MEVFYVLKKRNTSVDEWQDHEAFRGHETNNLSQGNHVTSDVKPEVLNTQTMPVDARDIEAGTETQTDQAIFP
jgi:hypothetical protein